MSEEYNAALAEELTEANIASDCLKCNGSGVLLVGTEWNELVKECDCLKNYRDHA